MRKHRITQVNFQGLAYFLKTIFWLHALVKLSHLLISKCLKLHHINKVSSKKSRGFAPESHLGRMYSVLEIVMLAKFLQTRIFGNNRSG